MRRRIPGKNGGNFDVKPCGRPSRKPERRAKLDEPHVSFRLGQRQKLSNKIFGRIPGEPTRCSG